MKCNVCEKEFDVEVGMTSCPYCGAPLAQEKAPAEIDKPANFNVFAILGFVFGLTGFLSSLLFIIELLLTVFAFYLLFRFEDDPSKAFILSMMIVIFIETVVLNVLGIIFSKKGKVLQTTTLKFAKVGKILAIIGLAILPIMFVLALIIYII